MRCRARLLAVWLSAVIVGGLAAGTVRAGDPAFDVPALLATRLDPKVLSTTETNGVVVEEISYHSHVDGTNSVDIFAFFAYPKGARQLPAFVWNQCGLGKADANYAVRFGANRGYAALCIDFPMPGYRSTGGYPINSTIVATENPKRSPIWHGAVALLKAVSYLETRPEVDPDRIGMSGCSWGGYFSSLMAGLDRRLQAVSSMYGCGGLELGNAWWGAPGGPRWPDARTVGWWRAYFDTATRMPGSHTAYALITGTDDTFYWLGGVNRTYRMTPEPKHLTLLPNVDHDMGGPVFQQVFLWLDIHLQDAAPFLKVTDLKLSEVPPLPPADPAELVGKPPGPMKKLVSWNFSGVRRAAKAEIAVSEGAEVPWPKRQWQIVPATIKKGRCVAELPPVRGPAFVFGNVTDTDGYISSTPLLPINGATLPRD